MDFYLLADVGGTHARFAFVDCADKMVRRTQTYAVRAYPTLCGALWAFVEAFLQGDTIRAAALAAAGPKVDGAINLTNSDWVCDPAELRALLGIEAVYIFNDFEAVAYALPSLSDSDLSVLQAGKKSATHPLLAIGPGTGLGVAALVPVSGSFHAVASEGGNARYTPANAREAKIVQYIGRRHGYVRAEDLVSGPGLVNLYKANCFLADVKAEELEPADIVARAQQGQELYRVVLDDFAAMFGTFVSQAALFYLAWGGIYLTGGVYRKVRDVFPVARFLERFNTNPKVPAVLAQTGIYGVEAEIPAFDGLEAFLRARPV